MEAPALTARQRLWSTVGRLARFQAVSAAGTVVNLGALLLLREWGHLPVVLAGSCAVELAIVHNFTGHYFLTWRERVRRTPRDFLLKLLAYNAATWPIDLVANIAVLWALSRLGVHYLLAECCGLVLGPFLKYFVNDALIFGARRGGGDDSRGQ